MHIDGVRFFPDDGRVLKAVNRGWPSSIDTVIIENLEVFEDGSPVVNLHVHHSPTGARHLVVVSESQVKALPLERCNAQRSCRLVEDRVGLFSRFSAGGPRTEKVKYL